MDKAWKRCSLIKKPSVLSHLSPPQSQCHRHRPRAPCCFFCTVLYTEPEAAAFHLHPGHSRWDPQTTGPTGCTINIRKKNKNQITHLQKAADQCEWIGSQRLYHATVSYIKSTKTGVNKLKKNTAAHFRKTTAVNRGKFESHYDPIYFGSHRAQGEYVTWM